MRRSSFTIHAVCLGLAAGCGRDDGEATTNVVRLQNRIVQASCGQCQLGLPGTGCDLAIAFDDRAYYVDGSHIDDHGDAHGPDGLCNAIRPARVTGRLVDERVLVDHLELVADPDS